MYKFFIRPLFFLFDAERVHHFTFFIIKRAFKIPFLKNIIKRHYAVENKNLQRNLFGLTFNNPVGLAAGFDKNGELFNELSDFGFGFIEVGTITPKPQDGNEKKRIFRLKQDKALINRMGFNNDGVSEIAKRLKKNRNKIIIGGNIGKNKVTQNDRAVTDYVICFKALFNVVDYFVVNVSSPNTPNLRELQEKEPLTNLLIKLQEENNSNRTRKPILLKIAPDLSETHLLNIIDIVKTTGIDGVIATNTTISRDGLISENKNEIGGLSGKPLSERSTEVIRFLAERSNKAFPIIGVGGIHSADDALEKLKAGADLVQVYTGFIYEGPALIKRINKAMLR
jgi:dihydroorotate dehydrogenase